ncbi:MAG: universal stress protein, partial [Planctomycetaceae bacterium]|nr:universal stress protein [Planctomycetaceae bacterium]
MSWLPKQKVVVPVDFSESSLGALETGLELVADAAHLHAIHVLPVLEPADPGVIWNTVDNHSRAHHAQQALREQLSDPKWQALQIKIGF